MLKIGSYGISDLGLKRTNNEDAFVVSPEMNLFVVADGMGGAAAGEVASQMFIKTSLEVFATNSGRSEREILELVQEVFRLANERILKHAIENPHHQGLGCTAELMTFTDQNYVLGHVGDSRAYLFRRGQLRQLTRDHSLVQGQIEQGLLTPIEARKHSLRNVILRAVGIDETLALDLLRGNSHPGDVFLLCSDGLTDMVEDRSIQDILLSPLRLDQKVEALIDLAKSAGGKDNITVVLCEVMQSQ
jgi:protein phosphatase